jgi:hypothetical protein
MVRLADITRNAFMNGDLSTVMSPRTVITWAENADIFGDVGFALARHIREQVRRARASPRGGILSAQLRAGIAGIVGECCTDIAGQAGAAAYTMGAGFAALASRAAALRNRTGGCP